MAKNKTMTELLREALTEADSLLSVDRATGVKRQSMAKFLRGEQSLRLDMADKLADYFGLVAINASDIARENRKMKAHQRGTKEFRELTLSEMRAAIASAQRHLNDMRRVYHQEKELRVKKRKAK